MPDRPRGGPTKEITMDTEYERFMQVLETMAFSFQLVAFTWLILAGVATWALLCRAEVDRCRVEQWRRLKKPAAQEQRPVRARQASN
jgi:hypothetical protein